MKPEQVDSLKGEVANLHHPFQDWLESRERIFNISEKAISGQVGIDQIHLKLPSRKGTRDMVWHKDTDLR